MQVSIHVRTSAAFLALVLGASGCANMTPAQQAATGAAIGAVSGAAIGRSTSDNNRGRSTTRGAVIGAAAGAAGGYIWSQRMQRQKEEMERATAGTGVDVSQTQDNRLKLNIPSDISFDTSRADIKPNFRPILDQFARTLKENSSTRITIVGHTDSTGSDRINDPLSINRAAATRDYLAARGVNSDRIMLEGRGSREPIADNATASGRAQNRRVEIFVAEPTPQ
jgi:outer membrane protein OmpA-like peptidoglycan-associated protein